MIFSEIYSAYYNAVSEIIKTSINSSLTDEKMREIIKKHAFSESHFNIIPSLKSGKWQLLTPKMKTNLRHVPNLPLTLIQKRWLKSMLLDPRIKLFDVKIQGLDNIEPLFLADDYVVYDKYCDGDPYTDEGYIKRFRMILDAVKNSKFLLLEIRSRRGNTVKSTLFPKRLEYSPKDDKFRLITEGCRYIKTVNLSRIISCKVIEGWSFENRPISTTLLCDSVNNTPKTEEVVLEIYDTRNALERCLLHFTHFEKTTERIGENSYRLTIRYNVEDETELIIRVLSFGPHVEVVSTERFRGLITERLAMQSEYKI